MRNKAGLVRNKAGLVQNKAGVVRNKAGLVRSRAGLTSAGYFRPSADSGLLNAQSRPPCTIKANLASSMLLNVALPLLTFTWWQFRFG